MIKWYFPKNTFSAASCNSMHACLLERKGDKQVLARKLRIMLVTVFDTQAEYVVHGPVHARLYWSSIF